MHAATATRSFASNSNNNNKTTTTATTTAACYVYCVAFFFVTKLLLEFHIMCIYLLSKLLANWQTYLFLVSFLLVLPTVHDLKKNLCWKNRNRSWPSCERCIQWIATNLFRHQIQIAICFFRNMKNFDFNWIFTVICKWRNVERLYTRNIFNKTKVHFEMHLESRWFEYSIIQCAIDV